MVVPSVVALLILYFLGGLGKLTEYSQPTGLKISPASNDEEHIGNNKINNNFFITYPYILISITLKLRRGRPQA